MTTTIGLDLGPNSSEALARLQALLQLSAQADVIRMALQTLDHLATEAAGGSQIVVVRSNGDQVQVTIPGIPTSGWIVKKADLDVQRR